MTTIWTEGWPTGSERRVVSGSRQSSGLQARRGDGAVGCGSGRLTARFVGAGCVEGASSGFIGFAFVEDWGEQLTRFGVVVLVEFLLFSKSPSAKPKHSGNVEQMLLWDDCCATAGLKASHGGTNGGKQFVNVKNSDTLNPISLNPFAPFVLILADYLVFVD